MPLPTPPIFRRSRRGRVKAPLVPPAPPPPPPGPPVVLHVLRSTPSTYVWEFDQPVAASMPDNSNLNVNGMTPVNAGNLDGTHVVIEFDGDALEGSPWTITGIVGWLSPAPGFPQSGTTEEP